jgi:PQQ-like domain
MCRSPLTSLLPLLVLCSAPLPLCGASDSKDPEEHLLEQNGVSADGPGLLDFFRNHSPAEADQRRLEQLIRQLGSEDFAEREQASRALVAWGPGALPLLKHALESEDREVVRRAKACLEQIGRRSETALVTSALHLLVRREPPGAVEALLAFAPSAQDPAVEGELLAALGTLGRCRGEMNPALVAALGAEAPARRAVAAYVLAAQGDDVQQESVRRLLDDPAPQVRLRAAHGLLVARDRSACPALIRLLREAPRPLAWQAEELLFRVAGDRGPAVSLGTGTAEARDRAATAWGAWWRQQGGTLDLNGWQERPGRLTLIVEPEAGTVWECGPDGSRRWELRGLQGPMDALVLSEGRVLIPEIQGQRVTERTFTGEVLWQKQLPKEFPCACQRLPNGDTFIATRQRLLEVRPDGAEVWSRNPPADFIVIAARWLPDAHVICLSSQGVVLELDPAGQTLQTVPLGAPTGGWGSVDKLANGHYLVALESVPDGVREVDEHGDSVWRHPLPKAGPGYATPLASGDILIADASGHRVLVVNRRGEVLWSQETAGRPVRAHRR